MKVTCKVKENSWTVYKAVIHNGHVITKGWYAEVSDTCENCGKELNLDRLYYCNYALPMFCSANCVMQTADKHPGHYKIVNVLPWEADN